MKANIDKARDYAKSLRQRLGSHLKQVVLFGSQARGEAREGSDYDFLVVVDDRTEAIRETVLDVGVEMLDRYDQVFASLLCSEKEWSKKMRFPIGWNIQREGVVL